MTKQEGKPNDMKAFIAGLKTVIRNSWPTQEEFAQGVTSKVNMSNILRETGGTSLSMRQALAAKAGMTVEEVTNLGKAVLNPPSAKATVEASATIKGGLDPEVGHSANELMGAATDLAAQAQVEIANYTRTMTQMLKTVTAERDKLMVLLAQEQTIMNAMPVAVKMVDKSMKVLYANRAMMERFQVFQGDPDAETHCGFGPIQDGVLQNVFNTGESIHKMMRHSSGVWYAVSAHPLHDNAWTVSKVVILIALADSWFETLQTMGWVPPSEDEVQSMCHGDASQE